MPSVPGIVDQLTQPIYDTVQLGIAAGAVTYNMFSVPLNGPLTAAINKGYQDTNLIQAGRLEKSINMTIQAIGFAVRDFAAGGARVTQVDYMTVMNTGHLNLMIGQVSFLRMPLLDMPPGPSEVNMFSNIGPAATEYKLTHGVVASQNLFWLDYPLELADQESITVEVTVTGIVAVTDVHCVLYGTQTRPPR